MLALSVYSLCGFPFVGYGRLLTSLLHAASPTPSCYSHSPSSCSASLGSTNTVRHPSASKLIGLNTLCSSRRNTDWGPHSDPEAPVYRSLCDRHPDVMDRQPLWLPLLAGGRFKHPHSGTRVSPRTRSRERLCEHPRDCLDLYFNIYVYTLLVLFFCPAFNFLGPYINDDNVAWRRLASRRAKRTRRDIRV